MVKKKLMAWLKKEGHNCIDVGNKEMDAEDDYVDFASLGAKQVLSEKSRGIFLCKTGVGMCVAANRVKGIRAVQAYDAEIVRRSREDEDSNVLCVAAEYISTRKLKEMIVIWLATPFSGVERHSRRIQKLEML